MSFRDATALQRVGDGIFGWEVPDGWQQGRGAWGGLVTGGVVTAVLLEEPDPTRRLRTVSIHMAGPLTVGLATVRVNPLRVGSGLSTWGVTVDGPEQGLVAHAVVVTGRARAAELTDAYPSWGVAVPPSLPSWSELEPLPTDGPGWPRFMQHVEFRAAAGLPVTGPPARCTGYIRFTDDEGWDGLRLLSIVDAWYPAAFTVLEELRPMATVTYAAHLLVDPTTVPSDQPLGFESHLSAAHEGFTTETRRLWTPDGRLAVENHQAVAVIR